MLLSTDRRLVIQAVLQGQIGVEHVTVDELVLAHHLLADQVIRETACAIMQAGNSAKSQVFDLDWQITQPN